MDYLRPAMLILGGSLWVALFAITGNWFWRDDPKGCILSMPGIVLAIVGFFALANPAWPQQPECEMSINKLAEHLSNRYKERPVWGGQINGPGSVILSQSKGGSWTFVFLRPDGQACALAHGERGRFIPNKVLEGS